MTEIPPHLRARLNEAADTEVAQVVAKLDKDLLPARATSGALIALMLLSTGPAVASALGAPWWAGLLVSGWLLAGLMAFNLHRRSKALARLVTTARAKTEAEALRLTQERKP